MMKWLLGMAVLAVSVAYASVSLGTPQMTHAASVKTHVVMIHGYTFIPHQLVISTGDKVLWINKDPDTHTVTSDGNASTTLRSRALGSGARYSMTYSRLGTFHYHCEFHPFMRGTVRVRARTTS
jgi:plastocyanin